MNVLKHHSHRRIQDILNLIALFTRGDAFFQGRNRHGPRLDPIDSGPFRDHLHAFDFTLDSASLLAKIFLRFLNKFIIVSYR